MNELQDPGVFRENLKFNKDDSLLFDNPEYFLADVMESLGVSKNALNNPAFTEQLYKFMVLFDKQGGKKITEIAKEIERIVKTEHRRPFDDPMPIDRENHESLYQMLESFDIVEYCNKLLKDNEFMIDQKDIIKTYNELDEGWRYRIKIDEQTGGFSYQEIAKDYGKKWLKENSYIPDEKGNVIWTMSYYNFNDIPYGSKARPANKVVLEFSIKTTYNSNGTEMESEHTSYFDSGEKEFCSISTRHKRFPFAIHYKVTLNEKKPKPYINNNKILNPKGTEKFYALRLKWCELAHVDELEFDEENEQPGQYVTFKDEDEMEAYYKLHKEDIDRYLKELGLHVETRGFDI